MRGDFNTFVTFGRRFQHPDVKKLLYLILVNRKRHMQSKNESLDFFQIKVYAKVEIFLI